MYLDTCLDVFDEKINSVKKTIPFDVEKQYLFLSSFILTTGYKRIVERVFKGVKKVIGETSLSHLSTFEWVQSTIIDIRGDVEKDFNLFESLIEQEGELNGLSDGRNIKELVSETRDILER